MFPYPPRQDSLALCIFSITLRLASQKTSFAVIRQYFQMSETASTVKVLAVRLNGYLWTLCPKSMGPFLKSALLGLFPDCGSRKPHRGSATTRRDVVRRNPQFSIAAMTHSHGRRCSTAGTGIANLNIDHSPFCYPHFSQMAGNAALIFSAPSSKTALGGKDPPQRGGGLWPPRLLWRENLLSHTTRKRGEWRW